MAPSTPPPPSSDRFAALTIASTVRSVMSAVSTERRADIGLIQREQGALYSPPPGCQSLSTYAEEIILAERHTLVPQDGVGRGNVEVEIRHCKAGHIVA